MLSAILSVLFVGLVALCVVGVKSKGYTPMTEKEVDRKMDTIIEKLEGEIRINNFAFGAKAPDFNHIVDEYHKYKETCEVVHHRGLKFYGLEEAINNIVVAVRKYKIGILGLEEADRQFYVELNNIQKELNMLAKQAKIVRF